MSNSPHTTELTAPPAANMLQRMNEIQEAERATIALMSTFSNSELLDILSYAKEMENASWRIQCACHAEIVNRKLPKGEKGALIEAAARQEKCAPGTLYRNADIHELAEKVQDIEDKQVFIEILTLPKADRVEALEVIANKILSNEKYGSPSDIRADINAMKGGEAPEQTETVSNVSLRLSQPAMQKLTSICSQTRQRPVEWLESVLWTSDEPKPSKFCVGVSEECLVWLAQKAAKRVETYGPDDEKGTPEGYLDFILQHRMRESERKR